MVSHIVILAKQDGLIDALRNKVGAPLSDYADLFAGVLGSIPLISDRKTSLKYTLRVLRKLLSTSEEDILMSRHAYKNIRKAFYVLLYAPVETLPVYLHNKDPYDPIPFFVAWRLAEGVGEQLTIS